MGVAYPYTYHLLIGHLCEDHSLSASLFLSGRLTQSSHPVEITFSWMLDVCESSISEVASKVCIPLHKNISE